MRRLLFVLSLTVMSCTAAAPQRWYTTREVLSLTSLSELMRVQAERTDAVFRIRGFNSFSDEEFQAMFHTGLLLQVSGARIAQRFEADYGEDFAGKANHMVSIARALERAAEKRDSALTRHHLLTLHDVCTDCHDAYR